MESPRIYLPINVWNPVPVNMYGIVLSEMRRNCLLSVLTKKFDVAMPTSAVKRIELFKSSFHLGLFVYVKRKFVKFNELSSTTKFGLFS